MKTLDEIKSIIYPKEEVDIVEVAKDLITENMFRINVGLTFSEGWFMKWKVQ